MLVVAIPSYNRPDKLRKTVEGITTSLKPDDVVVFEQPAGKPAGLGVAWSTVCSMAVRKHGAKAIYLLLDDDVVFPLMGDVRSVMEYFEDSSVGMVQMQGHAGVISDYVVEKKFLFHSVMVRGEVFCDLPGGRGVNYDTNETVSIECGFTLDAWLAGWRLLKTRRARIIRDMVTRTVCFDRVVRSRNGESKFVKGKEHAAPKGDGGIEGAIRDGVGVECSFKRRFVDTGLVTCRLQNRGGVLVPYYPSIIPTKKADKIHEVAMSKRAMVRKVGV